MSFMLFICLIMIKCDLQFACSFMKESRSFYKLFLFRKQKNTFKKDLGLFYILFFTVVCKLLGTSSLSVSHIRRYVIVTDVNGISPESPITFEC